MPPRSCFYNSFTSFSCEAWLLEGKNTLEQEWANGFTTWLANLLYKVTLLDRGKSKMIKFTTSPEFPFSHKQTQDAEQIKPISLIFKLETFFKPTEILSSAWVMGFTFSLVLFDADSWIFKRFFSMTIDFLPLALSEAPGLFQLWVSLVNF